MQIHASQLNSRPQVLVIDDSPDVHRLLSARLRSEDLDLIPAESGRAGLDIAEKDPPSVVLLDLDMPEMDGFEVLRRLKDSPTLNNIPVIVLSGLQSPHDKVTAFDLGAMDYICKPFDLTELRVRIRAAVRLSNLLLMLSQRAQIDGLTGLYNRAHFDHRWREEVARARRKRRPLALAGIDCDHFKSINDNYGHPAGDAVLQGLAAILQRACRETDLPCRYGGEEFFLIMPDTTPDQALAVCERVRTMVQDVVWPRHPDRGLTVSIGLVGCAEVGAVNAQSWVEDADKNLYAAKQQGRNRVVMTELPSGGVRLAEAG